MGRIMIVEDDEAVRELLREILKRAGHEVVAAGNGKEAIALYQDNPATADLVITNILMPEKEGLEMIQEMRRDDPDIKIIAISGGGQIGPADYLEIARRFGATRTFSKPFDRKELLAAVEELLEESD
jgi:DNA-binding NtrC family response regulator